MARKTLASVVAAAELAEAVEERDFLLIVQAEQAQAVYDYQDDATKAAIHRVVGTLRTHMTPKVYLDVGGKRVEAIVSGEATERKALYLGVQVVVDMALVGIRVANFRFDPTVCVVCGDAVKPRKGR